MGKFVLEPMDISDLVREMTKLVKASVPKTVTWPIILGLKYPGPSGNSLGYRSNSAEDQSKSGSPQEFDGTRILGRFPEDHKFGVGRRYALRLKQQVAQVLVSPPAT